MEGQENSLKPYLFGLYIERKLPKTIPRTISSFTVKEDHIVSAVSEILCYKQKKLTTFYIRIKFNFFCISEQNLEVQDISAKRPSYNQLMKTKLHNFCTTFGVIFSISFLRVFFLTSPLIFLII